MNDPSAHDPAPVSRRGAIPAPAAFDRAMCADRPGLMRRLRRIERARRQRRPHDRDLARLRRDGATSIRRRRARAARMPRIDYPPELPITGKRPEILEALRRHPVIIVCGETGSGKSTQLPKMLLEVGCGAGGWIGHTQPRRLAARTLARRLADELASPLGRDVGFKVRFTDKAPRGAFVKLMTDGMLLAETQHDRGLDRYDAILLDEAHERSLNIDFLLGYLRELLRRRRDLKVVVTSATIDAARFAEHFATEGRPAPILEVSGRVHPVDVRWRPPEPDPQTGEIDEPRAVAEAVTAAAREGDGDMLVFLPTQHDIMEVARQLRGRSIPGPRPAAVLPLYARLPIRDQRRVFEANGEDRRIVLATNVAESSVTVPGIRFVVDTGTARISRYSSHSRIQRLPVERVARASCDQRKGRCGRVGPGICIRLYAEEDFFSRREFPTPEIHRANLAAVILRMKALRLGRIEGFPFLDPPRRRGITEGMRTLREVGALDPAGRLTPLGRRLARLPVDPRIGRILLAAHEQGCLAPVLVIAAALETRDPRERPEGREEEAKACHARFADPTSDFLGFLRMWDFYRDLRAARSRRGLARACHEHFLSANRCREWADVHRQLRDLVADEGMHPRRRRDGGRHGDRAGGREHANACEEHRAASRAIHRAILAGFLSHVAERTGRYEYTGSDGAALYLWPGSALFTKLPRWIVAAERVETSRRYARIAAQVHPQEIETVAGGQVDRTHRDPRWSRDAGHVLALEQVRFGELTLVPRRRVPFEDVDPVRARELFLRHALVEGDLETTAPFLRHNLELINEIAALEAKSRRRDLLANLDARYDFYDRIVPADVACAATFQRWRCRAESRDSGVLFMKRSDLVRGDTSGITREAFPPEMEIGGLRYPLRYLLAPGDPGDGVTLMVPVAALESLDARRLEWGVPGMLREKIVALIRTLPRERRRRFVPIPATADAVLPRLRFGEGSLLAALARELQRLDGQPLPEELFDPRRLDPHLCMNLEVRGEAGGIVAAGRDLAELRVRLRRESSQALEEIRDPAWHRDGVRSWDFGTLPPRVPVRHGGVWVPAFPSVVDAGDSVGLRLRGRQAAALRETRHGIRRLAELHLGGRIRWRIHRSDPWERMILHGSALGDGEVLEGQIADRVTELAMAAALAARNGTAQGCGDGGDLTAIRDEATFRAAVGDARQRVDAVSDEVVEVAAAILDAHHEARMAMDAARKRRWSEAVGDAARQVSRLVGGRFLSDAPWPWLCHVPRYLHAVVRRFERVAIRGTIRDQELAARIEPHERAHELLAARVAGQGAGEEELERHRWLLEEFRVSVLAQELGTSCTISAKRLEDQRREVERRLPPPPPSPP